MRVAVVQMTSGTDFFVNRARVFELLQKASDFRCELVLLPEMCFLFPREKEKLESAFVWEGMPLLEELSCFAKKNSMNIAAGTMNICCRGEDKLVNRLCFFSRDGKLLDWYDKIHLFDALCADSSVYRESELTRKGERRVVCDVDGVRIGMSVCYDLRFANHYWELAAMGAKIFLVPAAFTRTTGADHWEVLLRARAIENQAFVLSANQYGDHENGLKTWGRSMVIDPWGTILAQVGDGQGLAVCDLDLDYQEKIRRKMPCLSHRS